MGEAGVRGPTEGLGMTQGKRTAAKTGGSAGLGWNMSALNLDLSEDDSVSSSMQREKSIFSVWLLPNTTRTSSPPQICMFKTWHSP